VISPAKTSLAALAAALALAGCASNKVASSGETAPSAKPAHHKATAPAQTIGGAVVDAEATIAANIAKAPNLTTLVKAVGAAGLTEMLAGPGPYTVFAPTNAAFGRLAPGTVETLLKPENRASLVKLLDYSIVAGRVTAADLRHRIAAGNGTTTLATTEGDPLTVTLTQNIITLTDVNGNKSYVQADDITQSNGIVHVVNGVLIPNLA
jgi:uncharacterized surface protein with fasciclin (FAS1) repeats